MSPSERAIRKLPPHLRRYVVAQDYAAYTPRDQAVWRHILRRLVRHLATRAHESYLRGLEATGIGTERIPSLDEMNEKLARLGWAAVSVRGFIPPAVFTELQAMRVLAIASDIRSHEHIEYTPAPDIVHESAGHAPILADPAYATFLQRVGELGFRAIASAEDTATYDAIRALSIVKEDPAATPDEIAAAERQLEEATASRRFVSEATRASRLYWWTAEYGLVGRVDAPRIYGAGLLSSIGESTHCFSHEVEKIPLDVGAAEVEFDITRMQPQLFVVRELAELVEVVDALAATLAWRRGGDAGLGEARRARTVNHLVLADGTELSGVVEAVHEGTRAAGPDLTSAAVVVRGPTMLSRAGRALGPASDLPALVAFGEGRVPRDGSFCVRFGTGLALSGRIAGGVASDLRASIGSRELAVPPRAIVLASPSLPSVAGGPGDPGAWDWRFGKAVPDSEAEARARTHKATALPAAVAELYREVRALREEGARDPDRLEDLSARAARLPDDEWLLRTEIEELGREETEDERAGAPAA
ncbi:MAG: aromatic amino acid hydroxylase [Anaeromyxobacteraceae bacterium]